jgi:hypothetical protein
MTVAHFNSLLSVVSFLQPDSCTFSTCTATIEKACAQCEKKLCKRHIDKDAHKCEGESPAPSPPAECEYGECIGSLKKGPCKECSKHFCSKHHAPSKHGCTKKKMKAAGEKKEDSESDGEDESTVKQFILLPEMKGETALDEEAPPELTDPDHVHSVSEFVTTNPGHAEKPGPEWMQKDSAVPNEHIKYEVFLQAAEYIRQVSRGRHAYMQTRHELR